MLQSYNSILANYASSISTIPSSLSSPHPMATLIPTASVIQYMTFKLAFYRKYLYHNKPNQTPASIAIMDALSTALDQSSQYLKHAIINPGAITQLIIKHHLVFNDEILALQYELPNTKSLELELPINPSDPNSNSKDGASYNIQSLTNWFHLNHLKFYGNINLKSIGHAHNHLITSLEISNNCTTTCQPFINRFYKLNVLSIINCNIADIYLKNFASLSSLTISNSNLSECNINSLVNLIHLDISHNNIAYLKLTNRNLTCLDISFNTCLVELDITDTAVINLNLMGNRSVVSIKSKPILVFLSHDGAILPSLIKQLQVTIFMNPIIRINDAINLVYRDSMIDISKLNLSFNTLEIIKWVMSNDACDTIHYYYQLSLRSFLINVLKLLTVLAELIGSGVLLSSYLHNFENNMAALSKYPYTTQFYVTANVVNHVKHLLFKHDIGGYDLGHVIRMSDDSYVLPCNIATSDVILRKLSVMGKEYLEQLLTNTTTYHHAIEWDLKYEHEIETCKN